MRITEIQKAILDTLIEKKFIGTFEVTIYHSGMKDIKISGFRDDICVFNYNLEKEMHKICFLIVSGTLTDGDFTFDINGQIAYLYTYGVEE